MRKVEKIPVKELINKQRHYVRPVKSYAYDYTPEQIREALGQSDLDQYSALDELEETVKAVFGLINFSNLNVRTKNAFHQLEKQFMLYRSLLKEI